MTADLLADPPETISPGVQRYTYNMTLQSSVLQKGDFFVLYDFGGYKPESLASPDHSNWVMSDHGDTGPYPSGLRSTSTSATTLMWTYEGPRIAAAFEPLSVGRVSAAANVGYRSARPFSGYDSYYYYSVDSPEPSTIVLLGAGLGALFYLRRRQRTSLGS